MITKEYLQQELAKRIDGYKRGVETSTDNIISEMKSILVLVDALPDHEKKYNEALELARAFYIPTEDKEVNSVLEQIFPELRESENERIRKRLVLLVKQFAQGLYREPMLAYLEKQKEPILTSIWKDTKDEIAPAKRDILGWYRKADGKLEGHPYIVWFCSEDESSKEATPSVNGTSLAYWAELPNEDFKKTFWYEEQKEQKPCEDSGTDDDIMQYVEEGKKRGIKEVISFPEKYGLQKEQKPAEWSEEDEKMLSDCIEEVGSMSIRGDVKTLRDWLKSLPERFNFQPKQEWSEEDKEMIDNIISSLHGYICIGQNNPCFNKHKKHIQKEIDFLNALRPQPHWKPSKEQMRALIDVICFGKISYVGQEEELIALKNQLLKLM